MCVAEEHRLVGVVLVDRRITIEMVGAQIRHHTDCRVDAGRVVELERRYLQGDPVGSTVAQCDLRQRDADVARRDGVEAKPAKQVRGERGHRRLAVRSGDRNVAQRRDGVKRDLDLADDRQAGFTCPLERRRGGRNTGAGHDQRRFARCAPGRGAPVSTSTPNGRSRPRSCPRPTAARVGRVYARALAREQRGNRRPALAETDDGDLADTPDVGNHRSLSVVRARNAQRIPRIQNRVTTCTHAIP